jgi:oxygen-dependent protoporphyrinogen oxidase
MPVFSDDKYSTIWSLLTDPVYKGLFTGVIQELRRHRRPADLEDESVGSFLNRRLGAPNIGNNIVSAILHGIFAGDIDQLSMKSLFPGLWHKEDVHGSVALGLGIDMTSGYVDIRYRDYLVREEMLEKLPLPVVDTLHIASLYYFRNGMGTLSCALEKSLRANPNVEFKMNHKVNGIEYISESEDVKVSLPLCRSVRAKGA